MLGRTGIVVVFAALAIGGAAGWFAAGAWGKSKCENVEVCKCENVESANEGGARHPATADAAAEKPKVTEAELAALRTKAASLDKELKDLLDANRKKAKTDALERAAKILKRTSRKSPRKRRCVGARHTGN